MSHKRADGGESGCRPGRRVADRSVRYVVKLPSETSFYLEEAACWHACDPEDLIPLAVAQYVRNRMNVGPSIGFSPEQEVVVAERLAVLQAWHKVRQRASADGLQSATRRMLDHLARHRGIRVGLSTLYGWERRFNSYGKAGLIDGRRWTKQMRPPRAVAVALTLNAL